MDITYESQVTLKQLVIQKDINHYIIEDVLNSEFYEMPEVCISAIELINRKEPLDDVEKELIARYPDENIDILNFVSQLIDLNLISELDGEKILSSSMQERHSGFSWIPQTLSQFFFNPVSAKLYVLLLIASVGLILFQPNLFPRYSDLFAFDLML